MTYSKQLDDGTIVGSVEGVTPGTYFVDRQDLHNRKVHRGLQVGIAPHGSSVVLSGGYPDDRDDGDTIIYTGEGGRDANTSRQVSDQKFTKGNKALAENHLRGLPVRVVRGRKYASGIPAGYRYRYDGLYRVAQSWIEIGRDGFKICRFRLERLTEADFPPIPGPSPVPGAGAPGGNKSPGRREARVTRVIRQTEVSDYVKRLHDYTCQICSTRLETPRGPYAEGAHVKPLGLPHLGPDTTDNVLCLCPNCHVLFDEVAVWTGDDLSLYGCASGSLRVVKDHNVSPEYLRYHRTLGGH